MVIGQRGNLIANFQHCARVPTTEYTVLIHCLKSSRIAVIIMRWQREGVIILSSLLVIVVILWLGRSAVKQENDNVGTCLHLNQDQVSRWLFILVLLLLKVTELRLEGSQLACVEGCHLAELLLELHCTVQGGAKLDMWSVLLDLIGLTMPLVVNLFRLVSSISLLLATLCLVLKSLLAAPVTMTLASYFTHAACYTPSLRLKKLMQKKS